MNDLNRQFSIGGLTIDPLANTLKFNSHIEKVVSAKLPQAAVCKLSLVVQRLMYNEDLGRRSAMIGL